MFEEKGHVKGATEMMTPREKAIEWIELAQTGAEVGIADPAMRATVLQNLTQAIELLQTPPAPSNPASRENESAATEGVQVVDEWRRTARPVWNDDEGLQEWARLADMVDALVGRRLSALTGSRILGYADSGGGIRWREDAGGYTGHLWSGPAPSAPSGNETDVELLLADCAGLLTIDKDLQDDEWERDRREALGKYEDYLFKGAR